MCVLPIGSSILVVSFPWLSSFQIGTSCLSWFCPCSITALGLPGGLLLLQSQAGSDRRDTMLQTLCLLLVVDYTDFSTSTHQSTSSLLTLSDQKIVRVFLQSHLSQLSNLCISSFLSVNDSAPYTCSSVLQMTVFTILSLRLRLKDFVEFFVLYLRIFLGYS